MELIDVCVQSLEPINSATHIDSNSPCCLICGREYRNRGDPADYIDKVVVFTFLIENHLDYLRLSELRFHNEDHCIERGLEYCNAVDIMNNSDASFQIDVVFCIVHAEMLYSTGKINELIDYDNVLLFHYPFNV